MIEGFSFLDSEPGKKNQNKTPKSDLRENPLSIKSHVKPTHPAGAYLFIFSLWTTQIFAIFT